MTINNSDIKCKMCGKHGNEITHDTFVIETYKQKVGSVIRNHNNCDEHFCFVGKYQVSSCLESIEKELGIL